MSVCAATTTGCRFIERGVGAAQTRHLSRLEANEIDRAIERVENGENGDGDVWEWLADAGVTYRGEKTVPALLGELYAARSRCVARHMPIASFTEMAVVAIGSFRADESWKRDAQSILIVPMVLFAPFDLVCVPWQLCEKAFEQNALPKETLREALDLLEKAREHGFERAYEHWGGVTSKRYYVDVLLGEYP